MLRDLAYPIPLQVIACLCDIDDEHIPDLKRWGQSFIELMSTVMSPDRQVEVAHDMAEYQRFFRAHIDRKRADPGDDLASELLAGGGAAPFTESELVTQMVNVVVGGHETTVHLIANVLHLLLRQPARWQAIVADRTLIPAVIEETLRVDAPVPALMRTATADTELAGSKIAAGDVADPELFDLHRRGESPRRWSSTVSRSWTSSGIERLFRRGP